MCSGDVVKVFARPQYVVTIGRSAARNPGFKAVWVIVLPAGSTNKEGAR